MLKKGIIYILFFLILNISNTVSKAQVVSPQIPEPIKSTTTQPNNSNVTPANNTTLSSQPIGVPVTTPRKKRRLRAIKVDSVALRDSLLRASTTQNVAQNSSAFNITPSNSPTAAIKTDSIHTLGTSQVPVLTNSNNPFEILRGGTPEIDTSVSKAKTMLEQAAPSLLNRETYSKNFLFWILLITLSMMALVVANARSSVTQAYKALLSNNALRQIYRLQAGWGNITQLALYGLFLFNAGIFTFLMYYRFVGKPPMNQFWSFTFCLLGVSLVFLIKHTILYIVSAIFPISKEVKLYNFIIITSGILLGLILLPLNIFIAYSPEILGNILTYMAFATIVLVYLVRSLRSLSVASPFLATDQFHFLVYLCVVEVAPLFVLVKLLISK